MFNPVFTITNKTLMYISKIEASEDLIRHAPILPLWEKEFREEAIVRAVYHGTHLEGNMLEMGEAKDVLMGRDVVGRPRDIQEIINYRKVIDFIDEEAKRKIEKITEPLLRKLHRIIVYKILPDDQSGEYRLKQVIIRNSQTGEVTFRPPPPLEVPYLMREFFYWLNSNAQQELHPMCGFTRLLMVMVASPGSWRRLFCYLVGMIFVVSFLWKNTMIKMRLPIMKVCRKPRPVI